jgi:transposase
MRTDNQVTIGLDVSDRWSQVVVLDDNGVVVVNDRVRSTQSGLRTYFRRFSGCLLAMEVGPHSLWMERVLEDVGLEVIVANPRQIGLVYGNNRKSDEVDAENLARLARFDPALLHPVRQRREDTQATMAILRAREVLVASRTRLVNSVRGQVKSAGGRMPSCSTKNFHQHADALPELIRDAMLPVMEVIEKLNEKIVAQDKLISELCRDVYPETEMFTDIDGVGNLTALTFFLTIEEPGRFPSSRAVGSYLGLRPRRDQSGAVDKQLSITKAGDARMRALLSQCAHRILGPFGKDSDLRRWGLKLVERGGSGARQKAIVAVSRKLAVLMHRLWVTGEVYEPLYHANRMEHAA